MSRASDPDSKAGRIAAFFDRNPDEWLTLDDAVVKFGFDSPEQARNAIKYVRSERGVAIEAVTVFRLAEEPRE